MKNLVILLILQSVGGFAFAAIAPLPSPSTSPDGKSVIRYTSGATNPNSGQDGVLVLNPGSTKLEPRTIGIKAIEVYWRPDSGAVVIVEHFTRTDTIIVCENTAAGWQIIRNPASKTLLSALGSRTTQVATEQTVFGGWVGKKANFTAHLQYRDGQSGSFSYSLTFPGSTVEGWKQNL